MDGFILETISTLLAVPLRSWCRDSFGWKQNAVSPEHRGQTLLSENEKRQTLEFQGVDPPGPRAWKGTMFPSPAGQTFFPCGDPITTSGPSYGFFPLCLPDPTSPLELGGQAKGSQPLGENDSETHSPFNVPKMSQ